MVRRLREMGFIIKYVPDSTFYLYVAALKGFCREA